MTSARQRTRPANRNRANHGLADAVIRGNMRVSADRATTVTYAESAAGMALRSFRQSVTFAA